MTCWFGAGKALVTILCELPTNYYRLDIWILMLMQYKLDLRTFFTNCGI